MVSVLRYLRYCNRMATRAVDVRHWTRDEYEQLAESGAFPPGKRLELVDGVIYEMSPQKGRHAAGIRGVEEALGPHPRPRAGG